MKVLGHLFSPKSSPKTEREIATLIEGFANGSGGRWEWDFFINTNFENERIRRAQAECLKVDQEFPPTRRREWCSEQGLNRLRDIASELRATAKVDSDQDANLPLPKSPQFKVEVQLSNAARKKLTDNGETVLVHALLAGHPKDGADSRFLVKPGLVNLAEISREICPGETAAFEPINLNPEALAEIDSQGPKVSVSVVSGRRSSKDNLLYCNQSYVEEDFDSVNGKTIVFECQLLEERFPS